MRKIERFVCDKCNASFATGDECHRHEETCGKTTDLIQIVLAVDSEGICFDASTTIGEDAGGGMFRVCDESDMDGTPIEKLITAMEPEVESADIAGFDFSIWCTADPYKGAEAEQKLREYAKTVLKDQRSKLDTMIGKLEEV